MAHEFIRRFVLHVLPDSFMRVRHFGYKPPLISIAYMKAHLQ